MYKIIYSIKGDKLRENQQLDKYKAKEELSEYQLSTLRDEKEADIKKIHRSTKYKHFTQEKRSISNQFVTQHENYESKRIVPMDINMRT